MNGQFGHQLRKLHAANAWLVLFLAISEVLLYFPPMRALLGGGRVWLKDLHIAAGLVSVALLLMYVPFFRKHIRQLRARRGRQLNLIFVLLLLTGWMISGIVLWRLRDFPPPLGTVWPCLFTICGPGSAFHMRSIIA